MRRFAWNTRGGGSEDEAVCLEYKGEVGAWMRWFAWIIRGGGSEDEECVEQF
jgi:hypothetical protein